MEALWRRIREYLKDRNRARRLYREIMSMAVLVVFVTTYVLILPAITIDQDTAATDPAINMDASAEEQVESAFQEDTEEVGNDREETLGESARTEEADEKTGAEEAGTESEGSEESETPGTELAEPEESATPEPTTEAQTKAGADDHQEKTSAEKGNSAKASFEAEDYTITVSWDKTADIASDVTLNYTELIPQKREHPADYDYVNEEYYNGYMDGTLYAIQKDMGEDVVIQDVRFLNLTLLHAGEKIIPADPVKVTIEYKKPVKLEENTAVKAVHFDATKKEPVILPVEVTCKKDASGEEIPDMVEKISFETTEISFYAITYAQNEVEETNNEAPEAMAEFPAVTFSDSSTNVMVNVTAEEGTFPAGTTMEVNTADAAEVRSAAEEVVDGAIRKVEAVDITFRNTAGEEIQPAKPIQVSLRPKMVQSAQDATVVHMDENGSANIVESEAQGTKITFEADSFSVYAIVYTVDFHYEVNGKMYDFSIPGGGFVSLEHVVEVLGLASADKNTENEGEVSEATKKFVADVERVEFSDPELVWVGKADSKTTVGEIKESRGLKAEYSAELTEEQIAEINAQTVEAGDWALISMRSFTSEESLTVTMKNGDQFVVKVTDDRVTSLEEIDGNKGYILYTLINGNYYVLKTDGSTVTTTRASDLDTMGNEYKWNIKYVYTDMASGTSYYMIKPCDDNSSSIDLGWDTTFPWSNPNNRPLVKKDNCNVILSPSGNGFKIEGYNNTKLVLENGWFAGRRGSDFSEMVIYDQEQLSQYKYTVLSDDYGMGKVCGTNDQNQYKEDSEFDSYTNNNKYNANEIKAVPQTSRYIFDYWDLNGERLSLGATIPAGTLAIPYQGSKLTAHFKKDPNWQASDEEKEGRVIDKESFQAWLQELRERNIPLNQDGCTKTAELYDYENRIYRVDLTAQSNLSMFNGDIDLGFIIDVSGSMQFPSKLVPVAGKESVDVGNINSNYYTQHQLDTNKVYYIIVDRTNTANVLRLKWCDGTNPAYPNRTGWPTGNPNSSSTTWHTGWGISGLGYEEDALDSATRYFTDTSGALFGGDNGPFQIYTAGDNGKKRREYLESSIAGTISELRSILDDLAYAQDSSEAADVKIAYNTFANDVDYNHTNHNFVSVTSGLSIGYDYKGGTDTEEALNDARDFFWSDSATKVAVLITDGAPQQSGLDGPTIDARVKAAAEALKTEEGVKLITIGLSMGDVKRGSRLLYDIATKDSDGDPYFYKADTGDELQYALYEVIQTVMADAIVVGNVTDTVNEAFYPVDKETGVPLIVGNVIDLNGIKIANSISGLTEEQRTAGYGVIGQDNDGNYTVTWNGQNFTWDGWHGTVYEKAKEDFLGGNAVRTNDPAKPATIVSEGYKIHPEDPTIAFKPEITTQGTKSLETPRVNVNELDLTDANTEWTVYLGTEVDPKSQLEAFYDNILVKEVVTDAADTDEDGFPDRMNGTSLYYPLLESISDKRESTAAGEQVTFKMKDLLKKLNNGTDITIDDLIAAGQTGLTFPYDLYGQDCPGTVKIKLIKTGDTANYDPHTTTVTGDAVETYTLLVDFAPDYAHLPNGQGGDGSLEYHTGDYSLAYQGNAAGEDYSTNTHIINVYNLPLDVYKTDENDEPLSGAVFKLYKAGGSGTVSGLSGKYTEVASGTSGADGVAHLTFAAGMENGLVPGTTYYLVEDKAPQNYTKVNTVWTVQVQTEIGKFTDLNDVEIFAPNYPTLDKSMFPFNWDQRARIVVDGEPVKVVAKGEAGKTTTITDGSYVSHKDAISFRHTVKNVKGNISIDVKKTWEADNDPNRPSSVTVRLYRVSEKGHQWGNGTIVPCTCTKDGVKEYTCSVCGAKDKHVIDKTGHKPGDAHQENYQAPTCTEPGSYDTVVRCTVCNAIISSKSETIPVTGHTWVNQETATSDSEHYCYDIADVCSVCGAVNEETRVHHAHDWGAWEVTTPAQPGVPGEETRICKHDPSHVDHREIPALSTDHTVTIYFRCTGDGNGRTYYPGQITSIATRTGTGSGDMTIKWNWDQWTSPKSFDVSGLGSSTYTTSSSGNYDGAEQTLTISNITSDLTLYITIRNGGYMGTNDGLIGQPTFSWNRNLHSHRLNKSFAPRRVGEAAATTPEVLSGISGLKTKTEAACGEKYWEAVSETYQITAADNWSLPISDLPKYNEYGKEYTYYVEEVPVTGYDTTYIGQESGLKDGGDLEIINTPKVIDLTVTKTWAFANSSNVQKVEGKEWPKGVTVHVVVYSKTGEADPTPTTYTVDLTADRQTYTFENLPEYVNGEKVEYSVVEAGITGLDDTNFNTVIEGNAEQGYTIKNTEKEVGLTIIKAFEGASLTDEQKNRITFTVTGSGLKDRSTGTSVESLTKTYADFVEGQWVLNQSDGIVAGGTYTVTETNGNVEQYTRVTTVSVNEGSSNTFAQGAGETNPSASITMSGSKGTVTITNTYTRLVNLKIIKVDANGMITPLVGARFELRKLDSENTTLSYLDEAASLPATTGNDHKTGSNGEVMFENLTDGYYEVKEAEMPAGYIQTGDGVFYIKVENGEISHVVRSVAEDGEGNSHVTWTPGENGATFEFTASSGAEPATAKVGNVPGAALPNAGGPGRALFYLIGMLLMAGAGLLMKRCRGYKG